LRIGQKIGKSGFDTHEYTDFINSDFQKSEFLRVHHTFLFPPVRAHLEFFILEKAAEA
jgi:hypothetical protein